MALASLTHGWDRVFSRPINDNHTLFLNMVEHIVGDPNLTNIRSRESPIRTFTTIEKMLPKAVRPTISEADYASRINNTEASITKVLEMSGAKNIEELPLALRSKKRLTFGHISHKTRIARNSLKMREGINNKFKDITLLNLLSGPLLTLVLFLFVRRFRQTQD